MIQNLKKSDIKKIIKNRLNEFAQILNKSEDDIFKEMCFCIMTANCDAKKCIEIHELINENFNLLSQLELADKFKDLGYRFPNVRSNYIIEARKKKTELYDLIQNSLEGESLRDWIVKNIKGLGYKEASHFLRNIGFNNYAIIDFHIIDLLEKHNLIEKPKTITKRKYLEIELILRNLSNRLNLNLAELDLYLWYLETGKILK